LHHAKREGETLQQQLVCQSSRLCITHSARTRRCSIEGCANRAVEGGICITHGAKVKRCSNKGCANGAVRGGFCVTHDTRTKLCSHKGCAEQARKGGLYLRHGKYSIASAAQNGAARPPHPAGGYDATAVVATAITGVGGGEIELDTHNLQAVVRCASSPRINRSGRGGGTRGINTMTIL
jgi:hypothetical protein